MPIDPEAALKADPVISEVSWTQRDVLLYHLSLGAGSGPDPELAYTYERDLRVLPTFAMVAGQGISSTTRSGSTMSMPGIDVDVRRLLHAGQGLTVHRPLPVSGSAALSSRVTEVWDKGKAALIVYEQSATGEDGDPLWTSTMRIWARGKGGFGGGPGPEEPWSAPDRAPDLSFDAPTGPGQALLYRLNGDLNPLHADPEVARAVGFDAPILHGLASYGIVAKTVVDHVLDGDAHRLTGLSARFSGTLVPGQTIRTELWRTGDELLLRATCPESDGAPVLTHTRATVAP
ncbi:MaoC family dehydratase [Nocardiopsis nanhaiensis]